MKRIKELELSSNGDLTKFALLLLNECILVVNETPTHCAYTTYDLGTVNCTISKSIETIKKHFELDEKDLL
jgi:hypothetical protein